MHWLSTLASSKRFSRFALLGTLIAAAVPSTARSQQSTSFTACAQANSANTFDDCVLFGLSSSVVAGQDMFTIAVQNLGSPSMPSLATTLESLVFSNGGDPDQNAVDVGITPTLNGIPVASMWDLFDATNAIFLTALGPPGVTNGNAPQVFTFATNTLYDPFSYQVDDLEFATLDGLQGASCGADGNPGGACAITTTPEPGTMVLVLTGFSSLVGVGLRRRRSRARA